MQTRTRRLKNQVWDPVPSVQGICQQSNPSLTKDYKYKSKLNTNVIWLPDMQRISQQSNSSLTKELQVQFNTKINWLSDVQGIRNVLCMILYLDNDNVIVLQCSLDAFR